MEINKDLDIVEGNHFEEPTKNFIYSNNQIDPLI